VPLWNFLAISLTFFQYCVGASLPCFPIIVCYSDFATLQSGVALRLGLPPFWNFPGRQREWISRARLIIRGCIFGRVVSLLWQLWGITPGEFSEDIS
jgi:hypothetical protein